MTKRKGSGPPVESRDSKAARIHATAMAIVESDALRMRSNTERLRALRRPRNPSLAAAVWSASRGLDVVGYPG